MLLEIKVFFLFLCIIYTCKFFVQLAIRLLIENPEPLKLTKWEEYAHYVALAYIITCIYI